MKNTSNSKSSSNDAVFALLMIGQVVGLCATAAAATLSLVIPMATALDTLPMYYSQSGPGSQSLQWNQTVNGLMHSAQHMALVLGILTVVLLLVGALNKKWLASHKTWKLGALTAVIALICISQAAESIVRHVISSAY